MALTPDAAKHPVPMDASLFLREQAYRCTRLAHDCPHVPTAHELEAIGIELMLKAAELDQALAD